MNITFRRVVGSDIWKVYDWSNDAVVRNMSFQTDFISKTEHESWFAGMVESVTELLFIAYSEEDQEEIGLFRIDDLGVLSILLIPKYRGKGYGMRLIKAVIKFVKKDTFEFCLSKLTAFIKEENRASVISFEKAGFKKEMNIIYKGNSAFLYSYFL